MKKSLLLFAATAILFAACGSNENKTAEGGTTKMNDTTATAATTSESKSERNKKTVMASYDAMNSHNVSEALKYCTADVVDYGDGSMPPVKGRDSIEKMINGWMTAFPDNKAENVKYIADGDWVAVWADQTGTWKGDFMGMKATNKSYKVKDVDIFKLNDEGQITEHHNVQSSNTMMSQVGMHMHK
ncbi:MULTISPECIES: ester cyclase [Niastella]|uniref:Ester cyclase n=1 Tax=Niastella soli TaxID=2821487 RepID=A0ABS3YSD4_9BACT|nr:ester cyclase [Niastella soli]MBO9200350.1 ester cyclase [Niastella soli]